MSRADGFPGQRLRILPGPLVEKYQEEPATADLLVTDCGLFPHAGDHGRFRPKGVPQVIFIACISGNGWCTIDNKTHQVLPNQVLVIPPDTPHRYGAGDKSPWSIWWFHASGAAIPGLLERASINRDNPVVTPREPHKIATLIEESLSSLEKDESPAAILGASGPAWHALALLADQYRFPPGKEDPVEQATAFIDSQINRKVSISDVARAVGLSESYLSSIFSAAHGMGILEYQTRKRMALARELLDSTELSVASVGKRCGYEDAFYFSRQFRKYHSQSPSEYRRSQKG